MKLGVICDGISQDLDEAVNVMDAFALEFAELQFVDGKEVGDHSSAEITAMDQLLRDHGKQVSCLSRHVFAGLTTEDSPGSVAHQKHMDALQRVFAMAHRLDAPFVRIMTNRKEQVLWGFNGAEKWNVAHGAWDRTLAIIAPAVNLAQAEGIKLAVETGIGTMVNSAYTARRIIDDLDARDWLQVLWDPCNSCWCHERAWPDGYQHVRDGYLGHLHIKDVRVDTPRARLTVAPLGEGQLADQLPPLAAALRRDGYDGVISLEPVYHAGDGDFQAGFRSNIDRFKAYFDQG